MKHEAKQTIGADPQGLAHYQNQRAHLRHRQAWVANKVRQDQRARTSAIAVGLLLALTGATTVLLTLHHLTR